MLHLFSQVGFSFSMRRVEEYWFKFEYLNKAEVPEPVSGTQEPAPRRWIAIYDAAASLAAAVTLLVLIFSLVFRPAAVVGNSMLNTFANGDKVACVHSFNGYEYGDVVIISNATKYGEPVIKRVIAVGGDSVDIDFYSGTVYVNGEALTEPYVTAPTVVRYDVTFPLVVPEGRLFVLGDNRNDSIDSRSTEIGLVNENDILGKVVFRFYPINKIGIIN